MHACFCINRRAACWLPWSWYHGGSNGTESYKIWVLGYCLIGVSLLLVVNCILNLYDEELMRIFIYEIWIRIMITYFLIKIQNVSVDNIYFPSYLFVFFLSNQLKRLIVYNLYYMWFPYWFMAAVMWLFGIGPRANVSLSLIWVQSEFLMCLVWNSAYFLLLLIFFLLRCEWKPFEVLFRISFSYEMYFF